MQQHHPYRRLLLKTGCSKAPSSNNLSSKTTLGAAEYAQNTIELLLQQMNQSAPRPNITMSSHMQNFFVVRRVSLQDWLLLKKQKGNKREKITQNTAGDGSGKCR